MDFYLNAYATCTSPIMHLICAPKILHKRCFQFLLGRLKYPGGMKNKDYAKNFKEQIRCIMGDVQAVYSQGKCSLNGKLFLQWFSLISIFFSRLRV